MSHADVFGSRNGAGFLGVGSRRFQPGSVFVIRQKKFHSFLHDSEPMSGLDCWLRPLALGTSQFASKDRLVAVWRSFSEGFGHQAHVNANG